MKVENPVAGSINEDVGDYTPVAIDSSESAESAEGTGNCEGSTFTDYVATEPDQSTEDSNNSTSSTSTAAVDSHDNVSAEPKSSSSSSSSSANPPEGAETTEVTAPAAETTAEAAPEAETTAEVAPEAVSPISPEEAAAKSLAERKENKEKLLKTFSTVFSSIIEQAKSSSGKEEVESGSNVGLPYGDVQMHGFLYKKSRWYTKVNISSQMWQRRWFVLGETFWYCRNPLYPDKNRREIPLWKAWKVSKSKEDPCVVEIYTKKQTYILRADEEENALRWAKALKERVKTVKKMHPELYSKAGLVDVDEEDDEDESLLEYPYGASTGRTIFWTITLPYSVLFTFTIPNVKKEKCKRMFPLTLIMVIVWLAIMSYAMIWGAQNFARSLSIPDDIMGVSITAIGASLPSLFGSIIAARQGSAKMAISNAFGANLCSILLALGIPCFIYSVSHHGHAFPCGSGAIFATVTVLFIALIVFLVIAAVWKLRLNYVHGIIFIILYAVLLAFIIVYNLPSLAL